jgi:hypothetical protein
MISMSRSAGIAFAALVAALALATAAHAGDPLKCKREIGKDLAKYVQAKTKAMQKCRETIAKGTPGSCPDAIATPKIAKADSKLRAGINKQCGGSTKLCTDGDAVALNLIGWDMGTCPSIEGGSCTNAIANCNDVSDCLICVGESAVDQVIALYYDDLVGAEFGTGSDISKCQLAIGKNAAKFLAAKNKALAKCEDAKIKGTYVGVCPDTLKAQPAIAKADSKKRVGICKACGGADKTCDGVGDASPGAVGFATNCPSVTIPGGSSCAGAITTAEDIVDCVDCVSEFKADCLDALSVPMFGTYPTECNPPTLPPCAATPNNTPTPCPTTTPGIVCPTQLVTEANGLTVDLDPGWTGQSHDAHAPSQNRITLAISGCSNPDSSTCGVCTTSGPLTNAGGIVFDNHRCVLDTKIQCNADGDCGAFGPCSFFFGSPLPLSAGGVSVCITNQIIGPVSGSVDIEAGTTALNVQLVSRVHTTAVTAAPCPVCNAGICAGGSHDGETCTVNGTSLVFGDVSFDCPPSVLQNVGNLPITLPYTTGTQTATLGAANPACRAPGFTGNKCFCDTCNNLVGTPCGSNADCVGVGATVCGGKRCLGGANAGTPCTIVGECPGGGCDVPGSQTKPNDCNDAVCSPVMTCVGGCNDFGNCTGAFACNGGGNDQVPCTVASECPGGTCDEQCPGGSCVAGNEGTCAAGPFEQFCQIDRFRSCSTNAQCPRSGDSCSFGKNRDCFTDNGVLTGSVVASGLPYPSCGGVGSGTVAALFCIPPTSSGSINSVSGLPGLGRISLPYTATFN